MRLRILASVALALTLSVPALAIDIIDIHQNTSAGVPTMLNQTVTVSGIVTSPNNVYSNYHLEIYIQDETAGINVWVSGGAGIYTAELGDSITVTAVVKQYQGLTELGTSIGETTITNHGAGSWMPDPLAITCADLNNTFQGDNSEPNEGRLIRINGVSIVDGTWPTTPQGSNSFIDISDGTATGLLFIDKDTSANGSPDPGSIFDVIGILKQYDSSSPYTDGYEIVPRYDTDIIAYDPGPPINGLVQITYITDTTAELYFETASPGSSEIEYGADDSYGNTAGDAGASTLEHTVILTGLTDNTIYHFRAKSSDGEGTRYGPDQLLATASDIPGEMHIAMSYTSDDSYAVWEEVSDNQNLANLLVNRINQANYSVDAALYSFSLTNVRDALIAAHQRGCLVRIIIEADNSDYYAQQCASYGIPFIRSNYGGQHGYGIMHNKYVIIDARDEYPYDDWVWTGSANMSNAGNDDVNNAVRVRDYGLAQAYTMDFNEMWGSDTQTPNSANSAMGQNKIDDSPHDFWINDLRVEQYMSPSDAVADHIAAAMQTAEHSVYFAILAFTDYGLSDEIRWHRNATPGLEVRGVFDEGLGPCSEGSMYYQMIGDPCTDPYAWDVPADVWVDTWLPSSRLMHHKYMIIDANWNNDDPMVATGSHNYSYSADTYNDENTLIIHDPLVANLYLQEFAQRYQESGGSDSLGVATGVEDPWDGGVPQGKILGQLRNFPNPFNPTTRLSFTTSEFAEVSIEIFDASGRLVRSIAIGETLEPGLHIYGWDGRDDSGRSQPSGTYFGSVTAFSPRTGHNEKSKDKLVLVK